MSSWEADWIEWIGETWFEWLKHSPAWNPLYMEMTAQQLKRIPLSKCAPKRVFWFRHFQLCKDPSQLISMYMTTYEPQWYDSGIAGGIRPDCEDSMSHVPKPVQNMREIFRDTIREYKTFQVTKTHHHATLIRSLIEKDAPSSSSAATTTALESKTSSESSFVLDSHKIASQFESMLQASSSSSREHDESSTMSDAERMFESFWSVDSDVACTVESEETIWDVSMLAESNAPELLASQGIWLVNTRTIQSTETDAVSIDWIPFWTMVIVQLVQYDTLAPIAKMSSAETSELVKACETFVSSSVRWESVRSLFDTPEERTRREELLQIEFDNRLRDAHTKKEREKIERQRQRKIPVRDLRFVPLLNALSHGQFKRGI